MTISPTRIAAGIIVGAIPTLIAAVNIGVALAS